MKFINLFFVTVSAVVVATVATAGSITVVSWGGAYTKSQVEAYHKPWAKKNWEYGCVRRLQWGISRSESPG